MTCNKCGEKPEKNCGAFPKAVIEIDNPEQIVLIRKVLVPASMGDESTFPPAIGKYHNVLLEYEASGGVYLYSSDGIPTKLSSDVTELQAQLNALRVRIGEEEEARADADTALSNRITSLDNSLATVAKTGSYNDLTNKPTIGNATLTIKRNGTNVGTFTANATTNKSINIAVPTKTSDLTNDGADGTSTYVEADELPTVDRVYSASSNNAIANSTVTNSLNRDVMTNLALDTNPSTTTINLKNVKTNLANPSSSTTTSIPLPVASSTQAGVMNSATFDAVTNNTNNINAIMNGAVAISNLPASPTQAQLTTAWENETGLTSLINRASVYDVTNNKVWTYYTNDQTWHAASNTSQVTVNTFTNSSEGTIKGSTNDGQVFAENDGTGSVNGWDTLTGNVASNTSKLATIEQGAEVNVQANWTQTDVTADDYIKNKPTIPTVNNATLTIQKNGTNVQTFTANSSTNKTANITVPTAVSELTNDASYATTTQLNNGLATKQNTLTAGNNIQINGNTISATDTTYTAGNAIDITNGEISADIHPADFFTAEDTISDCGSDLSLDDTMASTLRSVELKGDTYQQTYSGANLYNYTDLSDSIGTGITTDDDGWITCTVDNSAGTGTAFSNYYTKPLALSPSTQYVLVLEVLSVSGAGAIEGGGGSSASQVSYFGISFSNVTSGGTYIIPITSKSDVTGANGLRSYFRFNAGQSGSITVRFSVLADTSVTPETFIYQPYTGGIPAPNPDYPQDIQVVTGEQTVGVRGKNLLKIKASTVTVNGITYTPNADGSFSLSGTATANANIDVILPLSSSGFKAGEQYTLSTNNYSSGIEYFIFNCDADGTWRKTLASFSNNQPTTTVTLPDTVANYVNLSIRVPSGTGIDASGVKTMIELGSTATTYEPYQSQSYEINLGKNLWGGFPTDVSATSSSVSWVNKADGTITANGTATALSTSMFSGVAVSNNHTITLQAGTYTLSGGVSDTVRVELVDSAGTSLGFAGAAPTTIVLSEKTKVFIRGLVSKGATVSNITLQPQLEQGSTATSYAPYFTPIELCKIGDYQDYIYKSGDDWYVHKEIYKKTLNGSENWESWGTSGQNNTRPARLQSADISPLIVNIANTQTGALICNGFTGVSQGYLYSNDEEGIATTASNLYIRINKTTIGGTGTTDDFKNWLTSNNVIVYYVLATPIDTQITDTALVAQLNALAGARSYNDQTNIIVTAAGDNLPATLCVEAYRKSLSGVVEAIDNACTCRKNLVVYLPNGMTTYENNDAPISIPEVMEALERGQSVFLVAGGLSESVYTVTAANAYDGIWTMRADQTGINSDISDGHWHISGRDNLWRSVEFIPDTEQDSVINLSVVVDNSSWGTSVRDYKVLGVAGGETTIGHCNLSAAQGNAGLFVNDDTGVFVTVGEAYELIASGAKVKFNNVPVGQSLSSPHTSSGSGEDVFSGIELPVKYFLEADGAYLTEYTNSVVLPHNKGVPPLGVSIKKIDQGDILDYEFTIQGIIPYFPPQ